MAALPLASPADMAAIRAAVAAVGGQPLHAEAIAPDASTRRFFRVGLSGQPPVVACVYPAGEEERCSHDWTVHQWAWRRQLPVPAPLGKIARVILSVDLGTRDLETELREVGEAALGEALVCLHTFQKCSSRSIPNPPFDAALFRRELEGLAVHLSPEVGTSPVVQAFLDDLAQRLEKHPYRLTHRDFHANNLLLHENRVWAVDFQDLRYGPDTYDLVSLLRERAGGEVLESEEPWMAAAASLLGWAEGWAQRYRECACQRGLKVLGTFLRLTRDRHPSYLAYVPVVANKTAQVLRELGAPPALVGEVTKLERPNAYNEVGEGP